MPIRPDLQLEKCIDDALRKNDFKPLKTLLQIDICEDVKIKCSKRFLHKLDGLICRELNKKDIQTTSTIFTSVGRCAKNIYILGQTGLLTMIKQGLVQKEIILSRGNSKDEAIINLIEDIFDLLMAIHDINNEGKRQVVESFIPQICALVTDSRVNICIQQEALKKMNAILDKMPQDARKILSNQEILNLMSSMGERILDIGDYDLQVGILEALCRMTTEKQRQELAHRWFSMDFIANAFKGIKDSDFETDCRIFLNLVNGILGDKRRVFTFPCLSAFLDEYELQIPSDEKLEEFWIDFNLGSHTLSFYIAGDNDDHQWEAVTMPEEKVQMYSIEVRESKKLLTIILNNIIKIGKREGKELFLYFDASLEITKVAKKIFGEDKYREFARKQGISIAKTSLHILFDASGSQILVPESQFSAVEEKSNPPKELAKPPKYIKNINQGDIKNSQLEITPSKRKMSEASMIVPGSDRYTVRSPILLTNTSTPQRRRIKPPLQMISSAEKTDLSKLSEDGVDNAVLPKCRSSEGINKRDNTEKHIKTAKKTEKDIKFPNQSFGELQDITPDSQAVEKIDKPVLPAVLDNSCENKMHSTWACWTPVTAIKLYHNQRASALPGDTFNQDIGINKKHSGPKSSSSISISDDDSEARPEEAVEEREAADAAGAGRGSRQREPPRPPEPRSKLRVEAETTFKSVLLNKTVEESMVYRKKYILSKDVKTSVCDDSPSPRKDVRSQKKSGKEREKSKEKEFTNAAESLICQINKRYKSKDDTECARNLKESLIDSSFSNRSDLQLSKEKVKKKSHRKLKTTYVNVTSECPLNDVYNFNLNGADDPIIKLGIEELQATTREACVDNSTKLVSLRNHDELESSLKVKDKRIMTNHKKKSPFSDDETEHRCDDSKTDISWLREPRSKPQLIDYSRNKNVKRCESGKPRPSSEKGEPRSKMVPNKNVTKKVDETVSYGRTRLPRKAAKTKKNYKDLSNSESESEHEFSHSLTEELLVKEDTHSRTQTRRPAEKQQKVTSAETQEEPSKEWKLEPLKDTARDRSLHLSPLSESPSSIEVMRCTEKKPEEDFTQDYDFITKSLSPYPKPSSPESLNSNSEVESLINSFKTNGTNLPCASKSCSPILQPLVLENPSPSSLSMSSEGGEKIWFDVPCNTTHLSGFAQHLSCKRIYTDENLSNSNEAEAEEEGEGRAHLLPKRWCRAEDAEPWDSNISNVGMICDKINSEFQRKIHIRHKMMDYFTKHSWKMAEQHWKAVNHQTREHRINKLNKFQFIIIEELENFEKDSQSLKDLETEFADFWDKIFEKFRAYQRSEQQRLHLLKTSLDTNVFYNTDYEETVYTSEMCLMKENMKMLQDKLLQEMQEEELLDVRRGLMTLFMHHERNVSV